MLRHLHSDDAGTVTEKLFVQDAFVVMQRRHRGSMRQDFLTPKSIANLVTIVNEQQVGMAYKPTHFYDLAIHLMQLKHHFVKLFDFVLTYDNKIFKWIDSRFVAEKAREKKKK